MSNLPNDNTIVALATAPGVGAIAVVRLSGPQAIDMCNQIFPSKDLNKEASHTIHFGTLKDGNQVIDEVLLSLFVAPHSYTKENVVEISCHGSNFIVQQVIQLMLRQGARLAQPGEFTKRAFLNGQFDLAQAEAVADLIASDSQAAHRTALNQMRGGFSQEIRELRESLIHFASMIELELDFGEEDVEFASRDQLKTLVENIQKVIRPLIASFQWGNAIKQGVPTVIAGKPNAGKSTLLNALLNEEKAIVSDIPGTTRDFIEDEITIEGISFRFIDTAGLRETTDTIEAIGVSRTQEKLKQASLVIYMFDLTNSTPAEIEAEQEKLVAMGTPFIAVGNKMDQAPEQLLQSLTTNKRFNGQSQKSFEVVPLCAKDSSHIDALKTRIVKAVALDHISQDQTLVTNLRHYESLKATMEALDDVLTGIANQVTNDLLALDIRTSLHHLGEITGEITTEDLLENIFSKFCIGK